MRETARNRMRCTTLSNRKQLKTVGGQNAPKNYKASGTIRPTNYPGGTARAEILQQNVTKLLDRPTCDYQQNYHLTERLGQTYTVTCRCACQFQNTTSNTGLLRTTLVQVGSACMSRERACHKIQNTTRTAEATRGSDRFLLCVRMPQCVHAKIQNTARAVEATRGSTLLLFSFRFAFKAGKSVSVAQCDCTGMERALSKRLTLLHTIRHS